MQDVFRNIGMCPFEFCWLEKTLEVPAPEKAQKTPSIRLDGVPEVGVFDVVLGESSQDL